jgi:hypothetical protein
MQLRHAQKRSLDRAGVLGTVDVAHGHAGLPFAVSAQMVECSGSDCGGRLSLRFCRALAPARPSDD